MSVGVLRAATEGRVPTGVVPVYGLVWVSLGLNLGSGSRGSRGGGEMALAT